MAKALDTKQLAFVAALKAGQDGAHAAITAGYSPKSARFAARRLKANPLVKAELDRLHTELRERTKYDLDVASAQCIRFIELAEKKGDFSSVAKFTEQMQKMHGLHVTKVDLTVEQRVDINTALADARNRVSVRPMRDLPITIDNKSVGAQALRIVGPIDTQSTARPRGDDGGSFFEAGMYD